MDKEVVESSRHKLRQIYSRAIFRIIHKHRFLDSRGQDPHAYLTAVSFASGLGNTEAWLISA
jgi:hypothetical protein